MTMFAENGKCRMERDKERGAQGVKEMKTHTKNNTTIKTNDRGHIIIIWPYER